MAKNVKVAGHPSVKDVKKEIQDTLRQIVIIRDGGCVLRDYPESGQCGGFANDGHLILQAEHLVTRGNSISYGDTRNIVCLCMRHHNFFKPQHSLLYWKLIEQIIGPERWKYVQKIQADESAHMSYKVDFTLVLVGLKQELRKLIH